MTIGACLGSTFAQRVRTTVQLPEDMELQFDVNDIPLSTAPLGSNDLNFSPNIVFTEDSERAFVSYPGSSSVVAFNVADGEILAVIPVGENPSLLTLTPDGTQIGVVSLFLAANIPDPQQNFEGERIGSISMIDVQTFSVRTLDLTEVFFSFANNIVFSEDGSTGFVASAGTDELLRFDVETLTEISPRLNFGGGTRPTSLAMAPDFSFFTAVLVGSSALDELQTPDSVQIVDPGNFQIVRSIAPEPAEVMRSDGSTFLAPHRFTAVNNLSISTDGRYGILADQENSLGTPVPELAADHAILLDLEAGEVIRVFSIGGGGGPTVRHPEFDVFTVLSAVDLSFILPDTEEQVRVTSSVSQFRATSRPAFSADGRLIFVASPILDQISAFDTRTGGLRNLVQVGIDFDSGSAQVGAGPQHLTMSPDGQTLAVVNFNANTVDLLKNTFRVAIPEFLSTPEWFTGIALTNTGNAEAEIVAAGVSQTGLPFRDDPETEEEVELVNPQVIELEPGSQTAFTARELLEAIPGQELDGWLDLDTDQLQIAGFFLTGDPQVRRLDGGGTLFFPAQTLVTPGVTFREGFQAQLSVINSDLNPETATIGLVDSAGEVAAQVTQTVSRAGVFRRFLIDPDPEDDDNLGIFDPEDLVEGETYYLVVGGSQGLYSYLRYYDDERMASLNGIPILGPDAEVFDRLFTPQVVTFGGASTRISLVNGSSETAMITLQFRDRDGGELAAPVQFELESGHSRNQELAELFGLQDGGVPIAGWVEVESDQLGLVGSVEVELFSGRALTAYPLQGRPETGFVFSHVAEGAGFSTGIALLNGGTELANLTVSVHRSDGATVATRDLALQPGERLSQLLRDLFGPLPELLRGYVRVESDQALFGLELFYTDNRETLAVVPAQSLTVN